MTNYRHGHMISLIGAMDSPLLAVNTDRCLLVRHRNADCLRCANVCPTGAISLSEEGVSVSPERCIGCGTCASACPTGCLQAANPTDDELTAALAAALAQGNGHAVIACERAWDAAAPAALGMQEDGTPTVAVVCLGRADESLLTEGCARGAQSIRLISGPCESCPHGRGGALCDTIVQSAENLLAALGRPSPLQRIRLEDGEELDCRAVAAPADCEPATSPADAPADVPILSASDPSAPPDRPSQRSCSRVAPSVRTALKPGQGRDFTPVFPHVQDDGTLPHFVPERRLRLFNSLKALGTPRQATVTTRLWGQVSIDTDLCRSCRMCTVFCPTGAVARFGTDETDFGVEHRSALCMQCRLCETLCPENAITVTDNVSLDEFLTGRKFRFAMQPVGWNPGKEDAIASRMARFIKVDQMQEPQAKVKSDDTARRRDYAWRREERRREIRGEASDSPDA